MFNPTLVVLTSRNDFHDQLFGKTPVQTGEAAVLSGFGCAMVGYFHAKSPL